MKKLSCAFFGHRDVNYCLYIHEIENTILQLIQFGVTEFYHGNRGAFEQTCAGVLVNLKKKYPQIKHILVLSYKPKEKFVLPFCFDYAVYLQDNNVPPRFAKVKTNKKLIESVDYIVVAVNRNTGGAKIAYDCAKRLYKPTANVLTGQRILFERGITQEEIEEIVAEHEKLRLDEEYSKAEEEEIEKLRETVVPQMIKQAKKYKKKKIQAHPPSVWIQVGDTTTHC